MQTINIELSFNSNRLDYSIFAIYQLLDTLEDGYCIDFYLITNGIKDYSFMEKLKSLFPNKLNNYFTLDFEAYLKSSNLLLLQEDAHNTFWTNIVMARCYMWDMFPNLKRFIHIDDDVLILKSISLLWNYNNSPLIATKTKRIWMAGKDIITKYNLEYWFNGGIWLMDLDWFRKHNIYQKLIAYQKEDKIDTVVDERLMNLAYYNIYTSPNDNRFNFIPSKAPTYAIGLSKEKPFYCDNTQYCAKDDIVVVHWATGSNTGKPWVRLQQLFDPFAKLWQKRYDTFTILQNK